MARGVNKVILLGNLGDDPEVKYTQGGMAVTKVRLATTSVRKDRDGNTQERTEWHRVTFFGKLGEIAGEYLRKGSQIYLEGSIRYSKVEGSDGQDRYYTDVIADDLQMLGGRGDGGGESRGGGRQPRREGPSAREAFGGGERQRSSAEGREAPARDASRDFADDFADDDIPF